MTIKNRLIRSIPTDDKNCLIFAILKIKLEKSREFNHRFLKFVKCKGLK